MFDPALQSLAAVSARSSAAPLLLFAAGALTSVGPCVAPRFVALAGLTIGTTRRQSLALIAAFVAGLIAVYSTFGAASRLIAGAAALSPYTYAALAVALAVGGFSTLWRADKLCAHAAHERNAGTPGAAFFLGASSGLVISPCCTPLVLGVLAYTTSSGSFAYGSALLAAFALGHALPVIAVGFGVNRIGSILHRYSLRQASAVIGGTLMLGLAGYYGALA